MTDEKRQKCCRLCLAPDSECISILNSYAADKEPLTLKIYNCVHIKISSTDRLSLRICHACISYLNSWQSFKNRCIASQNKQQLWLDTTTQPHHSQSNLPSDTIIQQQNQEQQSEDLHENSGLPSSILDGITSLKKRKSLTVYVSPKQHSEIKATPKPKRQYIRHLKTPVTFPILQSVLPLTTHSIVPKSPRIKHKQSRKLLKEILEQPVTPKPGNEPHHNPPIEGGGSVGGAQKLLPNPLINPEELQPMMMMHQPMISLPKITPDITQPSISMPTMAELSPTIIDDEPSTSQKATQQLRLFRPYSSYNPLPAVQIKEEPYDSDDIAGQQRTHHQQQQHHQQQDECDEMVDPTLFLERTEEEGEEPLDGSVYGYANQQQPTLPISTTIDPVKEASCRACNLKFSTRANARRHERTLHPNLFELSTSTPNNTPITKPTAAFAAVLASQRKSSIVPGPDQLSPASLVSAQKYRQEIVNAFKKNESGGYDYESPEKYQHLLTDEKIVFLQQNEEFLEQYQTMTCRCCSKFYSTYKNFMAHMRKKYATLPRNLCFNCLKLNESKALFISHLKRRNCINLYKVLHALMEKNQDFAAAVKATAAAVPEKLRAKDLLVNKMYECKLCPKKFRLKLEFRTHVYDEHGDALLKEVPSTACTFCALNIEDPAERKRHYNNMECIVTLRCLTCEAKFDNHQKFIDHVYEKHLADVGEVGGQQQQMSQQMQFQTSSADNSPGKRNAGGGGASSADESRSNHSNAGGSAPPKSQYFSRMPQACPICGQQYNNYNNVLRHMESKHPDQLPQTYKCVKCGTGYPRLSNLREHMVTVHSGDKTRHSGFEYIVNADAVKISDNPNSTSSNAAAYSGRYDYVMKDLMSITNGGMGGGDDDHDDADDEQQTAKKIRLDNSAGGGGGGGNNQFSSLKECPICSAVFSNNIGLSNHMRSHTAAAQSAQAAAIAAARVKTPNSLTITATSGGSGGGGGGGAGNSVLKNSAHKIQDIVTAQQQAVFRRSLEQAADRRFRRMRCRICQRRFSSKKSYRFHMLNDHQIRNVQFIKCKLCDAEFAYEKGLKVHMFKIHNKLLRDEMIIKQYECDVCGNVFRNEQQLMQHKRTAHGRNATIGQDTTVEEAATGGESNSIGGVDQQSGLSTPVSGGGGGGGNADNSNMGSSAASAAPLYWYQCKYCPSNFNTNKKLAIHINSHDEFDSNDYSCKDCGNVYSGRKSLWVHRYKKHPQIAEPSECVLCKKVFFDSQMLENHIPTCNRKPITATGALSTESTQVYRHKTGDDDDDDDGDEENSNGNDGDGGGTNMKIRLPEVACTICGQRFTDQELFSKHIQMHEQELYTDNPLASMFDTGPADPNQFFLDCVNEMGEYACDLCAKTFTQMTALKVHRKWHFRGDSKQNQAESAAAAADASNPSHPSSQIPSQSHSQTQINHQRLLGLQAVGLMPNSSGGSRYQKRKRELKCEYCPSTFISNNNLRRHLYELHKDEVTNLPKPPKIETDEYLHCRRCNRRFENKREWIEHKVSDARITKPFGPFQWGCDLCGAYVSRKEKLINHIQNHMKESIIAVTVEQHVQQQPMMNAKENQGESASSRSLLKKQQQKQEEEEEERNQREGGGNVDDDDDDEDGADENEDEEEDEEEYESNGEGEDGETAEEGSNRNMQNGDNGNDNDSDSESERGSDDDDGDGEGEDGDGDDDDDDDDDEVNSSNSDEEEQHPKPDKLVPKLTIKRNPAMENTNDGGGGGGDDDSYDEQDEHDVAEEVVDAEDDMIEEVDEDEDDEMEYEVDDDDDDEERTQDRDNDNDNETRSSMGGGDVSPAPPAVRRFACDLCQVYFDSQLELQKHVKMHFLNGPGSVSLTEIKSKSSSASASSLSKSSNNDVVVTVSTS